MAQPRLRHREERALIAAAHAGSIDARNQLIVAHLPFIVRTVNATVGGHHPQFDDFVQEGVLGDCVGIERFDPNRSMSVIYPSYGYWWIRHFINRAVASESAWTSRAHRIEEDWQLPEVHSSNDDDTAERNHLDAYYAAVPAEVCLSTQDLLHQFRTEGLVQGFDLLDTMLALTNGRLSQKQRRILTMYYRHGWTYRVIGDVLGYSPRWIGALKTRALVVLREEVLLRDGV